MMLVSKAWHQVEEIMCPHGRVAEWNDRAAPEVLDPINQRTGSSPRVVRRSVV